MVVVAAVGVLSHSSAMAGTPDAILPCATYFQRADELKGVQPFVAHQLRLFGVEMAMKMSGRSEAGRFLMTQLDALEAEKKEAKFTTPPTTRKAFTVTPPAAAPAAVAPAAPVEVSDAPPVTGKAADDLKELEAWGADAAATPTPGEPKPEPPKVDYRVVQLSKEEALKSFALDLYERARAVDQPKSFPSASTQWGVVEAPKIARGLHAAAVILDGLKLWGALPAEVQPFQTAAFRRSQQLGQQIHNAFKSASPVPLEWAPVDVAAPFANFKPPAPAPPAVDYGALFPSAGKSAVKR